MGEGEQDLEFKVPLPRLGYGVYTIFYSRPIIVDPQPQDKHRLPMTKGLIDKSDLGSRAHCHAPLPIHPRACHQLEGIDKEDTIRGNYASQRKDETR